MDICAICGEIVRPGQYASFIFPPKKPSRMVHQKCQDDIESKFNKCKNLCNNQEQLEKILTKALGYPTPEYNINIYEKGFLDRLINNLKEEGIEIKE